MYRFTCYDDNEYEREDIRFIQEIASDTVAGGLRYVYGTMDESPRFDEAVSDFRENDFFKGLKEYISGEKDDYHTGVRLVREKVRRMLEKMNDPLVSYTFDIFEELLFYNAIMYCREHKKAFKQETTLLDRDRERAVALELMESFDYRKKKAVRISRAITRFHEMMIKDEQDSNMFFWDEDFMFFFKESFLGGIALLRGVAGEEAGYGYDYTCEIFTDIGLKVPLRLVGTREANRIMNEISRTRLQELLKEEMEKNKDTRDDGSEEKSLQ